MDHLYDPKSYNPIMGNLAPGLCKSRGLDITILCPNYLEDCGQKFFRWIKLSYSKHNYLFTTSVDELNEFKPHLVILLLLNHRPLVQTYADIKDIATLINQYNVMVIRLNTWYYSDDYQIVSKIPNDLLEDFGDYTMLYKTLFVYPNHNFNCQLNVAEVVMKVERFISNTQQISFFMIRDCLLFL